MENSNSSSKLSQGGHKLARRAAVVSFFTLFSRVFGLLRDAVIAYVLGAKASADAFYVAFRIPNLFRRLLAEGNLTLSFVPVFTEKYESSRKEAMDLASVTLTVLSIFLLLLTLAGVLGASYFVQITARGFMEDPEKFALTVGLTKITFPYLALVSLSALAMGLLNARQHFAMPALSPVLLNVGIIGMAMLGQSFWDLPEVAIAWGAILGGLLQLLIQIPPLIKLKLLPRISFNFKNPGFLKVLKLMGPAVYGSAVYQLNVLAMTFFASYLPTGAVSYLWYAGRIMEFPMGLFAIALATVALPTLSTQAAKGEIAEMKASLRQSLSLVWLLNLPAALGLILLAKPTVALLFQRGDFSPENTLQAASTLRYFALGLPFLSTARILASAFYALQEAKKPVHAANASVFINIILAVVLMGPLKHEGLALAVSLGALSNMLFLFYFYRKKVGLLGLRALKGEFIKIFLAAAIMSLFIWGAQNYWPLNWLSTWELFYKVILHVMAGAGIYFAFLTLFKSESLKLLLAAFKRRLA